MHISKSRLKIIFLLNSRTSKGNGCLKFDFFAKTANKTIFSAVAVLTKNRKSPGSAGVTVDV